MARCCSRRAGGALFLLAVCVAAGPEPLLLSLGDRGPPAPGSASLESRLAAARAEALPALGGSRALQASSGLTDAQLRGPAWLYDLLVDVCFTYDVPGAGATLHYEICPYGIPTRTVNGLTAAPPEPADYLGVFTGWQVRAIRGYTVYAAQLYTAGAPCGGLTSTQRHALTLLFACGGAVEFGPPPAFNIVAVAVNVTSLQEVSACETEVVLGVPYLCGDPDPYPALMDPVAGLEPLTSPSPTPWPIATRARMAAPPSEASGTAPPSPAPPAAAAAAPPVQQVTAASYMQANAATFLLATLIPIAALMCCCACVWAVRRRRRAARARNADWKRLGLTGDIEEDMRDLFGERTAAIVSASGAAGSLMANVGLLYDAATGRRLTASELEAAVDRQLRRSGPGVRGAAAKPRQQPPRVQLALAGGRRRSPVGQGAAATDRGGGGYAASVDGQAGGGSSLDSISDYLRSRMRALGAGGDDSDPASSVRPTLTRSASAVYTSVVEGSGATADEQRAALQRRVMGRTTAARTAASETHTSRKGGPPSSAASSAGGHDESSRGGGSSGGGAGDGGSGSSSGGHREIVVEDDAERRRLMLAALGAGYAPGSRARGGVSSAAASTVGRGRGGTVASFVSGGGDVAPAAPAGDTAQVSGRRGASAAAAPPTAAVGTSAAAAANPLAVRLAARAIAAAGTWPHSGTTTPQHEMTVTAGRPIAIVSGFATPTSVAGGAGAAAAPPLSGARPARPSSLHGTPAGGSAAGEGDTGRTSLPGLERPAVPRLPLDRALIRETRPGANAAAAQQLHQPQRGAAAYISDDSGPPSAAASQPPSTPRGAGADGGVSVAASVLANLLRTARSGASATAQWPPSLHMGIAAPRAPTASAVARGDATNYVSATTPLVALAQAGRASAPTAAASPQLLAATPDSSAVARNPLAATTMPTSPPRALAASVSPGRVGTATPAPIVGAAASISVNPMAALPRPNAVPERPVAVALSNPMAQQPPQQQSPPARLGDAVAINLMAGMRPASQPLATAAPPHGPAPVTEGRNPLGAALAAAATTAARASASPDAMAAHDEAVGTNPLRKASRSAFSAAATAAAAAAAAQPAFAAAASNGTPHVVAPPPRSAASARGSRVTSPSGGGDATVAAPSSARSAASRAAQVSAAYTATVATAATPAPALATPVPQRASSQPPLPSPPPSHHVATSVAQPLFVPAAPSQDRPARLAMGASYRAAPPLLAAAVLHTVSDRAFTAVSGGAAGGVTQSSSMLAMKAARTGAAMPLPPPPLTPPPPPSLASPPPPPPQ